MIEGIVAGAGSVAGSYMDYQSQKEANETNMEMYKKERRFRKWQMANAHQEQAKDMRKAGLNPLLSGGGGKGASASAGSLPTAQPTKLGEGLSRAVSNATDALRLKKEISATDSQIALNKAGERTQATQAELNTSNAVTAKTTAESIALKNAALKSQLPSIAKRAEADLKHAEIDAKWANEDAILRRTGNVTNAAGNLFGIGKFLKGWGKKSPRGYRDEHYDGRGEHRSSRERIFLD